MTGKAEAARPRAKLGLIEFEQGFGSWAEAAAAAAGYAAPLILEKARDALLQVKRGEVAAERDTVLFDRIPFPHAVIVALLQTAIARGNRLSVLDFGGSLGSSYFQIRPFLDRLSYLRWSIVEQAHFVACGRAHFEDEHLRFHETIARSVAEQAPDVILLSGVLEYLPAPAATLAELAATGAAGIVVDRTPVLESGATRVSVQHVPPSIYPASYPCWFFSREDLLSPLAGRYRLVDEFLASSGGSVVLSDAVAHFRGYHFVSA